MHVVVDSATGRMGAITETKREREAESGPESAFLVVTGKSHSEVMHPLCFISSSINQD